MTMDRFQNTRQPDWDWWGRLWPTPGETLRRLGVTPDSRLVEIGCGNGYFTLPAARITDPETVTALDLDGALLDELAHLADRQGITNIDTVKGDARELDAHLDEPVDIALFANTLHGVEDKAGLVEQVAAVLEPGGRFVVVNWADRPRAETTVAGAPRGPPEDLRMAREATRDLLAPQFSTLETGDVPPYHYAVVGIK